MDVKIYGYSDDLVEVDGDISEEYNVIDTPCVLNVGGDFKVVVEYGKEGTWTIKVELFEEEAKVLDAYKMTLYQEHDYSIGLLISSDIDFKIEREGGDEK